jgi:hypothetical protein
MIIIIQLKCAALININVASGMTRRSRRVIIASRITDISRFCQNKVERAIWQANDEYGQELQGVKL